ncbi:MAG: hypothetical protein DRN15_05275 [Thermoprotei archaeon]|nr:MAG: hypothetical protein DRN15_05275 [Thermoprotei archaeon]RLF25376.1 MAG: hypothetical protein DRM97_02030 [Thermoprotei archaeon]
MRTRSSSILKNLSCAVLAGGESSRFGSYKALAPLNGKPLIVHVVSRLKTLMEDILISVSNEAQKRVIGQLFREENVKILIDPQLEVHAPLIGFYTCLKHCSTSLIFVVACDMPYVSPIAVRILYREMLSRQVDAIVPMWSNGMIEPLHAIYSSEKALRAAKEAIKRRRLDMRALLEELSAVYYIPVNVLFQEGVSPMTFYNINYPRDLQRLSSLNN